MDVSSLKKGVAAGTVTAEQLLELLLQQMEVNRRLLARVEILEARLALYEPPPPRDAGTSSPTNFSVAQEERRREKKKKKKKRGGGGGRQPTAEKLAEAQRIDDLFPDGAQPSQCVELRTRVAWRIEKGTAIRVGYRIHKRKFRNDLSDNKDRI